MPSYATLQGTRRQLEVQSVTINQDQDTELFYLTLAAAEAIDDFCGSWFDERLLTLGFNGNVGKFNPTLYLKELPLVAINTLTNGNGDVIASANYTLLPTGTYPKAKVRLARGYFWRGPNDPVGSTSGSFCCLDNPLLDAAYAEDAIQIDGLWVFHRNYAKAWRTITLTVGTGGVDDDDTTLPISATVGTAFDVGNILRVTTGTTTEQMLVAGPIVDSAPSGFATTSVTVERGYNGTTPIAHTMGDPIAIWQPDGMIPNLTEMCAAAFYKGRDNATGDAQIVAGFDARMVIPVDLPVKIKKMLVPYRSWRRGRPG
jgi:hypothetical protein